MDPDDYELILESFNAIDMKSETLQTDLIELNVKTCQVDKFTFEKVSMTILYQIDSGSLYKELPKVTQKPPNCSNDFELTTQLF